ncbi:MAG: hypothetical protein WED04_09815 [Promethearchaeati archaeon SRVP18_Atabeyarchaeia-1]
MTRKWFQVARAEFLASTSRYRGKRRIVWVGASALGVFWALYIVPTIVSQLLAEIGPLVAPILQSAYFFPGFMRSTIMLVWSMLLIYPMSAALQEIKVGQWEIMLSHDVGTRSIMIGTFLAKIPVYGLVTLFLAPILVSPFAIFYSVSVIGQVFMYLTIFFIAVSTIWLANFLITAIQGKLGDSPRGNDLAKALGIVLGIIVIVPMYGLIYLAPTVSQILGTNVFLFLPFTWGADLLTWIIISFNGVGLPQSTMTAFASALTLDWFSDLLLLSVFSLAIIGLAFGSAGRLFRIGAGARTEKIVTVGKDGPFLRLIRRVFPGSFGVLLTTSLKDFLRKAQNVSMLAYAIVLSVILPFFLNLEGINAGHGTVSEAFLTYFITPVIFGWMLGIFSGMSFGGIGFLDSQDQLWIIKTPPKGATRFVKARVVEAFLMALIIATIPAAIFLILMNYSLIQTIVIWIYGYLSVCGSAMVGIGVSAINPTYDDTQSGAFKSGRLITVFIVMGTSMIWFFVAIFSIFPALGTPDLSNPFMLPLALGIMIAPLLLAGLLTAYIGARRLRRPY